MKSPWYLRFGYCFLFVVILVSVWWRVDHYVLNPSLFIDEANVALNLAERSFSQLWTGLDYKQYAPPIFLCLTKLCCELWGYSEPVLRLIPFVGSLVSFVLLYILGRKFLRDPLLLGLLLGFYGINTLTVLHSISVKQYVPDLVVSMGLVLWTLRGDYKQFWQSGRVLVWAVAGSTLIWASMPVVYVLAGVGVYFGCQAYRDHQFWKWVRRFAIPVTLWLISFGIYFVTILYEDATDSYLQNYHQNYFLDYRLWFVSAWSQNIDLLRRVIGAYVGHKLLSLVLFVGFYIWGSLLLWRERRETLLLLLTPLVLVLLSSVFGYYSLIERMLLFIMPIQTIVALCGMEKATKGSRQLATWIYFAIAVIFVIGMSGWDSILKGRKMVYNSTRQGLDIVCEEKLENEALFVSGPEGPSTQYYCEVHPHRERYSSCLRYRRLDWREDVGTLIMQELDSSQRAAVWLLEERDPRDDSRSLLSAFRQKENTSIEKEVKLYRTRVVKIRK